MVSRIGESRPGQATHNAGLEVVSRATQKDLLLDSLLLWRHLFAFGILTSRIVEEGDGAIKHRLLDEKRRATSCGSKEG